MSDSSCSSGCGCTSRSASPSPTPTTTDAPPLHAGHVRSVFYIAQMDCPNEENMLRTQLSSLNGISALSFNLMRQTLTVDHDPSITAELIAAIQALGFDPQTPQTAAQPTSSTNTLSEWRPFIGAFSCALIAEAAHFAEAAEWISALFAFIAVALGGLSTFKKGWQAVVSGTLNMNALMSIAVTGALLLRQWPEAAMVMVLFNLAEKLESRSLTRARQAISALLELAPLFADVRHANGQWHATPVAEIPLDAHIRAKPGDHIALDGIVVEGTSSINQAALTGESLPIDKTIGDTVMAGTLNQHGTLIYRVTHRADDSTLSRMLHAIETAQNQRAPIQRFVDRFAQIYTPLVCAIALAVAVFPPLIWDADWQAWLYKALVMLVIACPCALVISTPITLVSALTAAARHGLLIKGGEFIERGHRLKLIAFDKTGTLTTGTPTQIAVEAWHNTDLAQVRAIAHGLAEGSDHPVSKAITAAAHADNIPAAECTRITQKLGIGLEGYSHNQRYQLTNFRHIRETSLNSTELADAVHAHEQLGHSVVLLTNDHRVLALFAVADPVRPESAAALAELHQLGLKTVMLSGDNAHTAAAIAHSVGIDDVRAELLPEDKLNIIATLKSQHQCVGMVGDGINDAPALVQADVGFAMAAIGSDTAIETADVAIMNDQLHQLPRFIRMTRKTHLILWQNIVLALGIKVAFLIATAFGYGSMWAAVFADVGTSLLVIANGLRMLNTHH